MTTSASSATPSRPPARPTPGVSSSTPASNKKSRARGLMISLGFAAAALLIAGVTFAWVWPSIGQPALWGGFAVLLGPLFVLAGVYLAVNEKVSKSQIIRGLIVVSLMAIAAVIVGFAVGQGWFLVMNWLAVGMAASVVGGFFAITALFEVRRRMKR